MLGRSRYPLLAVVLYVACALWATWPAIRHVDGHYLARPAAGYGQAAAGDHLQLGWAFWLVGHQIERGASPLADPYSFRPEAEAPPNLQGWLLGVPYWPLGVAFGDVWAYDLVVLLSFVLAGGFACWWLRALGALAPRGARRRRGLLPDALPGRPVDRAPPRADRVPPPGHAPRPRAPALRARRRSRWRRSRSRDSSTSRSARSPSRSAMRGRGFRARTGGRRAPGRRRRSPRGCWSTAGRSRARSGRGARSRRSSGTPPSSPTSSRARRQRRGGARVRRLAHAAGRARRARRRLGAGVASRRSWVSPRCSRASSRSAPTCPGYETALAAAPGLDSTRVPERFMPIACLALAALGGVRHRAPDNARGDRPSSSPAALACRRDRPVRGRSARAGVRSGVSRPAERGVRRDPWPGAAARAAGLPPRRPLRERVPRVRAPEPQGASAGLLHARRAPRRRARARAPGSRVRPTASSHRRSGFGS